MDFSLPPRARSLNISRLLIILATIVTVASWVIPELEYYAMSRVYWLRGDFAWVLVQTILYQFLHGGILHLISNAIFILFFGTILENRIGSWKFLAFFLANTVFVGAFLIAFSDAWTVGISGFCMAILAYIALELHSIGHQDYKSALLLILLNIAIGLDPSISLLGHLGGAISGVIWWGLNRTLERLSRG